MRHLLSIEDLDGAPDTDTGLRTGIESMLDLTDNFVEVMRDMDAGTIVVLLPDGGWKYLSSGAWTDPLDEVVERATRINYW